MSNLIITIGRENGSGGRRVGELLAEKLGIKFYDKELVTKTAIDSGLDASFVAEHDEKTPQYLWGVGNYNTRGNPAALQLFIEQSNAIKNIADRESAVIVGRCADYVLADYSNVIKIYIHAPLETRIARISARDRVPYDVAKSYISKNDKARASYYDYYTHRVWGAAKNYNLSIDTDILGIEGTADFLVKYIEQVRG